MEYFEGMKTVDIGDGHWLAPFHDKQGQIVGYYESHPRPDNGETCVGSVWVDTPATRELDANRQMWTVVQADPLTLSPSILCRACGNHGFVREGKWVSA